MKESPEREILKLIAYFDVFNYPLKIEEMSRFLSLSEEEILDCINHLNQLDLISINGQFVGTSDLDNKLSKRLIGNEKAEKLWFKAEKNARLISKFPFVRGVLISGSSSKGFIGEDGDLDFFIITKPGRLWVARTSLILYKKLFLFNSHKYFCVNYFVDEDHLEVEEKNIFTATELVTLLPMINLELHQNLIKNNKWVNEYYPSLFHDNENIEKAQNSRLKRFTEKAMSGKIGEKLDQYFMRMTLKRWQKKFSFLSDEDFEVAMKTTTNVSKHHPNNFQRKVLDRHQEILKKLIDQYEASAHVKTAV